MYNKEIETLLD